VVGSISFSLSFLVECVFMLVPFISANCTRCAYSDCCLRLCGTSGGFN
jgi:hypothetical protein